MHTQVKSPYTPAVEEGRPTERRRDSNPQPATHRAASYRSDASNHTTIRLPLWSVSMVAFRCPLFP